MASTGRIRYDHWVRDSFLQQVEHNEPTGIFAMPMPDKDIADPSHMCGMRIWLSNGQSIVCLFTDEESYNENT